MKIDCKKIAEKIYLECEKVKRNNKFLAILYSDENPAIKSFIKQKRNASDRLHIEMHENLFSDELFSEYINDRNCGGIIIQLPLLGISLINDVLIKIPTEKDVDALGKNPTVQQPVVEVIENIISEIGSTEINEIAIIGQGILIGKPVKLWAENKKIPSIKIYDKGFNRNDLITADLIISGAGSPNLFSSDSLKNGAIVIDFGYSKSGDNILGDFDVKNADDKEIKYTPTPGGTGPVLVACIMKNFCKLNQE